MPVLPRTSNQIVYPWPGQLMDKPFMLDTLTAQSVFGKFVKALFEEAKNVLDIIDIFTLNINVNFLGLKIQIQN